MPDLMMDFVDQIPDDIDPDIKPRDIAIRRDEGETLAICQSLLANHQLQAASRIVTSLLDRMIEDDTPALRPVRLLLQHYENALADQPPLAHVGTRPLRPNDMMYACFDQFLLLIHQQQRQIRELQMMLAEHL